MARLELAAASGILRRVDRLYVVADDELALGVYTLEGEAAGRIALASGELPQEPRARKALKPDFEALISLPDLSLLALGSGSTDRRRRAARVEFDVGAAPRVEVFSFDELYEALLRELPDLNLEGGAVLSDTLWLCSRGNSERRDDVLIALDLAGVCEALAHGRAPGADVLRSIERVSLGRLGDVPLSLTDLAPLRGQLVFTAAAEASPNTYDDGTCAGSVLGVIDVSAASYTPRIIGWTPDVKLEGVCPASDAADEQALFLVADADEPGARAPLYRSVLPKR